MLRKDEAEEQAQRGRCPVQMCFPKGTSKRLISFVFPHVIPPADQRARRELGGQRIDRSLPLARVWKVRPEVTLAASASRDNLIGSSRPLPSAPIAGTNDIKSDRTASTLLIPQESSYILITTQS